MKARRRKGEVARKERWLGERFVWQNDRVLLWWAGL